MKNPQTLAGWHPMRGREGEDLLLRMRKNVVKFSITLHEGDKALKTIQH